MLQTSEAIVMTKLLRDSGVAGCLSVVPYYNKPTQEGMFQHFKAIAECTDLPQLLYNVPGRTGSDMKPETVARLSQIENIVGIKEATGDVSRVQKIKQLAGNDFIVLSGDDATSLEAMLSSFLYLMENMVVIAATGADAETIVAVRSVPRYPMR